MKLYGVTGWKDQGKTTLVEALVAHFSAQGLTVSTIKHAHHAFDVDEPGRDSYRHRQAGAREVLLSSRRRFALMHELAEDEAEWELDQLLAKIAPVDLVLVEGYKDAPHRMIEVCREMKGRMPVAADIAAVRAFAGVPVGYETSLPIFGLDDVAAIAAFILDDAEALR